MSAAPDWSKKPHLQPSTKSFATADSFQNFLTRTGIGAGSINDAGRYAFNPITRNRINLEQCYRGSWIAGMAIDCVAEDMTREGVEIHSNDGPDRIKELETKARELQLWDRLCDSIKWSRLYGGALAWLMVDGQNAATPLDLDRVGKGQFKGVLPLDRWVLQPDLSPGNLIDELGPDFGNPKFYNVYQDGNGTPGMRIHHSRVIRLTGVDLPHYQKITENWWGQSVLERLWDRLIPFDSVTQGAAQLVYKAHLRTYKVKGLRQIIAESGRAFEGLVKQMEVIRATQSNEGLTLIDGEDELETSQYAFSGLPEMILQFGQQISGALGIPLVRLFGQSPVGLNSTGESDIRIYYDNIKQQQNAKLRGGVWKAYQLLYRSEYGTPPPDGFTVEFRPLWQMSDEQKAAIASSVTTAITSAFSSFAVDRQTVLKEFKQLSHVTGVWSNITDQQIKEAEDEPLPTGEDLGLGSEADDGREPKKKSAGTKDAAESQPTGADLYPSTAGRRETRRSIGQWVRAFAGWLRQRD